jgi:hypothetical protein
MVTEPLASCSANAFTVEPHPHHPGHPQTTKSPLKLSTGKRQFILPPLSYAYLEYNPKTHHITRCNQTEWEEWTRWTQMSPGDDAMAKFTSEDGQYRRKVPKECEKIENPYQIPVVVHYQSNSRKFCLFHKRPTT